MFNKSLEFYRRSWDVPVSEQRLIYNKNLHSERSTWCFDVNMDLAFDKDSRMLIDGKFLLPYTGVLTIGVTRRSIALIKNHLQPTLLAGHRLSRERY